MSLTLLELTTSSGAKTAFRQVCMCQICGQWQALADRKPLVRGPPILLVAPILSGRILQSMRHGPADASPRIGPARLARCVAACWLLCTAGAAKIDEGPELVSDQVVFRLHLELFRGERLGYDGRCKSKGRRCANSRWAPQSEEVASL